MITWLLDGNILIAMALVDHPHRGRCLRWFAGISSFATCPVTEGALLRVHMQHAADKSPAAAWRTLGAYRAHVEGFLVRCLSHLCLHQSRPSGAIAGGSPFERIVVEDSTSLRLPKGNADEFSGHGNAAGETAGCKIDLAFDLLGGGIVHSGLDVATEQDKTSQRRDIPPDLWR